MFELRCCGLVRRVDQLGTYVLRSAQVSVGGIMNQKNDSDKRNSNVLKP